ncbi:DNA (cytosine-5-)-methyltransferase [Sinorhizobium meliloti]|uniref:DNA cytosine methyltransferase n=1 Tax=Rhizobium meliloti TaxID=382 RepID=UPI0029AB955B|nr:DNA (cytosine-5-)-methyltransferase [Sinorhizobium meliloti]
MTKLRVLDLFSGIGGFSLGLERTGGFETVAFCEIDPFCRRVLAKHWEGVPIHDDVATIEHSGTVDVVTGGFPCQDVSIAGDVWGLGAGVSGERSGLFWHILRTVRLVGRPYILLENVAALLDRGMGAVLGSLASARYDAEWNCFPAAAIGSPQSRDRTWIAAYPGEKGRAGHIVNWDSFSISDATEVAQLGEYRAICGPEWAETFPAVSVDNGVSRDLVRPTIEACGNSLVPKVPELIGYAILEAERAEA